MAGSNIPSLAKVSSVFVRVDRAVRLRDALGAAGFDGALLARPASVFYLAGLTASTDRPAFVAVGPERIALVAPGSAPETPDPAFGYPVPGATVDRVADVGAGSAAALAQALAAAGLGDGRVAIESDWLSGPHVGTVAGLASPALLVSQ